MFVFCSMAPSEQQPDVKHSPVRGFDDSDAIDHPHSAMKPGGPVQAQSSVGRLTALSLVQVRRGRDLT